MDYHYKYKYEKYKRKYLLQKAGSKKTIDQQYQERIKFFLNRIENETVSIALVNEISDFFKQAVTKSYDTEHMHILEDKLATSFIANIAERKIIDITTIQNIASLIKNLNEEDYLKWYS
jgi:hypothetical protein